MPNEKTVYENNGVRIVREQSYAFGTDNLSTSWLVYSGSQLRYCFIRLKDAKIWAQRLVEGTI